MRDGRYGQIEKIPMPPGTPDSSTFLDYLDDPSIKWHAIEPIDLGFLEKALKEGQTSPPGDAIPNPAARAEHAFHKHAFHKDVGRGSAATATVSTALTGTTEHGRPGDPTHTTRGDDRSGGKDPQRFHCRQRWTGQPPGGHWVGALILEPAQGQGQRDTACCPLISSSRSNEVAVEMTEGQA